MFVLPKVCGARSEPIGSLLIKTTSQWKPKFLTCACAKYNTCFPWTFLSDLTKGAHNVDTHVSYFILLVKQCTFSIMTLQVSSYPFIFVLREEHFLILENYMKSSEIMNSVLKIKRYDNGIVVYFKDFSKWQDCKRLLKVKDIFYLW